MARLQERQRRSQQRWQSRAETFDALGDLAITVQGLIDQSNEREALATRQRSVIDLDYQAMDWIRQAPSRMPGSEMMDEFATWYDQQRDQMAGAIGFAPQRDLFMAETGQKKTRLAAQVANIGHEMSIEAGRETHTQSLSMYIRAGDIEGLQALWEDSVESDLFSSAELGPGGGAEKSIGLAAQRIMEDEGQAIFNEQGWDAFNEWINDPNNHPEAWKDTSLYISTRDRTLAGIKNSVADQAAVQNERMEAARGLEMAQFIEWSIPFTSGMQSISLDDLKDKIEDTLSLYSPLEKARLLRDIHGKARTGQQDRQDETSAMRKREAIVSLTQASRGLTPATAGHFLQLVNRHYLNGDFGTDEVSAAVEYRRWLSKVEEGAADVERIIEPGKQFIDSLMHVMRMERVAASRQLKEGYFIDSRGLYEKGETQALKLEPMEGDLIDVYDSDGERSVLSLTQIGDQVYGELLGLVKNAEGEIDVVNMARSLALQRIASLMQGRQPMEWVDRQGIPLPSDWTVAEVPVGKGRKQRLPNVEALQAGMEFIGEHGLSREQITVGTRPLSASRTGALAFSYMSARPEMAGPLTEARGLMWQQLIDEGNYIGAAELAADELPRDADQLAEMQADNALWDFTDHGDGSFSVQFERGGIVYPVFPREPGDDEALAAMWYPDAGEMLRPPEAAVAGPGGRPSDAVSLGPRPMTPAAVAGPEPAPAPPPAVVEVDQQLNDLQQEWDALTEEYQDIESRMNAPTGALGTNVNLQRDQLAGDLAEIDAERQAVADQITARQQMTPEALEQEQEQQAAAAAAATLEDLQREYDALTEEYLEINRRLTVPSGGVFSTIVRQEQDRLSAQQAEIAAARRTVGERISELRQVGIRYAELRDQKAEVLATEIREETRASELGNQVLDEILKVINDGAYMWTSLIGELQAIADMSHGQTQ